MDTIEKIIPEQETGAKTDVEESIQLENVEEAKTFFIIVKEKLTNVNRWHQFAGKLSADFHVTDALGNDVSRFAEEGDYFRISVPAPGPAAGEGFDWVRIEKIEDKTGESDESEAFGMTVRPAPNPRDNTDDIAHFFKGTATSSFLVKRDGPIIHASVHGRNEVPNTSTENPVDKARNAVIATGAIIGLSNPQWKSLVKGWLKRDV
jgi:hypothetical protein